MVGSAIVDRADRASARGLLSNSSALSRKRGIAVANAPIQMSRCTTMGMPSKIPQSLTSDVTSYDHTEEALAKRTRKHNSAKCVNISPNVSTIVSEPYVQSMTDAETLHLYQSDIWYTHKDYASFLKDRMDTISIFRSVNGDMSCLTKHYCTRGLEPHLQEHRFYIMQQKQRELVSSVLSEQRRQKQLDMSDAKAIQSQTIARTYMAVQEAIERAIKDTVSMNTCDDPQDNDSDDDSSAQDSIASDAEGSLFDHAWSRPAPQMSLMNMPLPSNSAPTSDSKTMTLEEMNLKLLETMKTKITYKTSPLNEEAISDNTLKEIEKELGEWDVLLQKNRKQRESSLSNASKDRTLLPTNLVQMGHNLSLTSIRRDSLLNSKAAYNDAPSLFSLQQYCGHQTHGEEEINVTIARAISAATTTCVSAVRRDSMAGATKQS